MANSCVVVRSPLRIVGALVAGSFLAGHARTANQHADPNAASVQRGRYLVQIGGCNDCHTSGYGESNGNIAEAHWLTGSDLGWRGPWGTTYPPNLRLVAQTMDEAQWLVFARNQWRPPMPWFNLRVMSDRDLGSIYRFLRYLGPAGGRAPAYVEPGVDPKTPVVIFGSPVSSVALQR